jgi:hypothetical protein
MEFLATCTFVLVAMLVGAAAMEGVFKAVEHASRKK